MKRIAISKWKQFNFIDSRFLKDFAISVSLFVCCFLIAYPELFESGLFQYYAKSFLFDYDFNLVNQLTIHSGSMVTPTLNFPDYHQPATAAVFLPFFEYFAKLFQVQMSDANLIVISILISTFCILLLFKKLISFYKKVFPQSEATNLYLQAAVFFLVWSGSIVLLRLSPGITCIVAFILTVAIEKIYLACTEGSLRFIDGVIIAFALFLKEEGLFLFPLIIYLFSSKKISFAQKKIFLHVLFFFGGACYLNQVAQFGKFQLFSNPSVQFEKLTIFPNLFFIDGIVFSNPFYLFLIPTFLYLLYRDRHKDVMFFALLVLSFSLLIIAQGQIVAPIYPYGSERIFVGYVFLNFSAFIFTWSKIKVRSKLARFMFGASLFALVIWGFYVKLIYFIKAAKRPNIEWGNLLSRNEIFGYLSSPEFHQECALKLEILKGITLSFAIGIVILMICFALLKRVEFLLGFFAVSFIVMSVFNDAFNNENGRRHLATIGMLDKVTICRNESCHKDLVDVVPMIDYQCKLLNDDGYCTWYTKYVCKFNPNYSRCSK